MRRTLFASRSFSAVALGSIFALALEVKSAAQLADARTDPGVVLDHPPHHFGGPAADLESLDYFGNPVWQMLADDVRLTSAATIRRISWFGFYGSTFAPEIEPPPAAERLRIRFYLPRAGDGLPGSILFEQEFTDPVRVATGNTAYVSVGVPEYRFQVDLGAPVAMVAGQTYWLEILQLDDVNSLFRWEDSLAEGTGTVGINNYLPDWILSVAAGDRAFQLSTTPEPSTLILVLALATRRIHKPGVR